MASITDNRQALLPGSASAQLDIDLLLAKVLQKPRSYLWAFAETQLSAPQQQQFDQLIKQRQSGQPMAYILGEQEFWSLTLKVTSDVLIPRADTETLVEQVLSTLDVNHPLIGADLGTGSGAIALALASERPSWQLLALDYSARALAVASTNARQLNLTQQTRFIQSDWAQSLASNCLDFMVSNPPYVDNQDPLLLDSEIKFEPRSALCADNSGLADLASISQQATRVLKASGHLWLEHGFEQGPAVRDLLAKQGFTKIQSYCDLAGLERVSYGQLSP